MPQCACKLEAHAGALDELSDEQREVQLPL